MAGVTNREFWDFRVKTRAQFTKLAEQIANIDTSGGGGTAYDRLDNWSDYGEGKEGYVLSAYLGYSLYEQLLNKLDANGTAKDSEKLGGLYASDYAKTETVEALSTKVGNKEDNTGIYKIISDVETALKADITAIPKFAITVVQNLPTVGDAATVYLVLDKESAGDLYTEYIYVNGKWENLGKQTVDLSAYSTTAEMNSAIVAALNDYAKIEDIPTTVSQLTDSGDYLKKASAETTYAKIASIQGFENRIKGLEGAVPQLNERVSTIEGDYATKDYVTTKLVNYAPLTSVQGFENRIGGLEGAVPQLNERVSTVEGKVSSLNETVSTGENNLLDRVNTIETDYVTSGNLESAINGIDLSVYLLKADLTKSRIQSTLGISDWALAATKPSYAWSEITSRPTALPASDVYAWAKAPTKPSYTAAEVGALSLGGGTVTGEFTVNGQPMVTKAGNATIIFSPNNREQNYWFGVDIYGTLFITDNGYNKVRAIIHEDNIGNYKAGNAGNSDMLGWVEASKYFKGDSTNLISNINADNLLNNACYLNQTGNGPGNENFPHTYSIFNVFTNGSDSRVAQVSISNDGLAIRRKIDSWGAWRHYINTDNIGNYNAGSATKLQTPRTLWGQSFDGTSNIDSTIRVLYPNADAGAITAKFLHYTGAPYGMVFRGYPTGVHTIQVQREANDAEVFGLALQPNGGNVGIGTASPSEKLEVNGNIKTNAITIGGVTLSWDSVNNALVVNGNMYATGSITQLGN